MKLKTLIALIVTTYIGFDPVVQASTPQPVFTPEQEARKVEVASEYLVTHQEILVAVSQKLQDPETGTCQRGRHRVLHLSVYVLPSV